VVAAAAALPQDAVDDVHHPRRHSILADHPRLYWTRDCTPGKDWFRFQKAVPTGRVWTSKDDSVTLPSWLGIPGIRYSIGLARWSHFSVNLLWVLKGIVFYVAAVRHRPVASLDTRDLGSVPERALDRDRVRVAELSGGQQLDPLQRPGAAHISYFITVFVAAPVSILAGLLQSPAISNRLGWFGRTLNRQRIPVVDEHSIPVGIICARNAGTLGSIGPVHLLGRGRAPTAS
jgi:methionine sulfoxide reductase catalytic subunit